MSWLVTTNQDLKKTQTFSVLLELPFFRNDSLTQRDLLSTPRWLRGSILTGTLEVWYFGRFWYLPVMSVIIRMTFESELWCYPRLPLRQQQTEGNTKHPQVLPKRIVLCLNFPEVSLMFDCVINADYFKYLASPEGVLKHWLGPFL